MGLGLFSRTRILHLKTILPLNTVLPPCCLVLWWEKYFCGHDELTEITCLAKNQVCVVFRPVSSQRNQFSDLAPCLSAVQRRWWGGWDWCFELDYSWCETTAWGFSSCLHWIKTWGYLRLFWASGALCSHFSFTKVILWITSVANNGEKNISRPEFMKEPKSLKLLEEREGKTSVRMKNLVSCY